MQRLEDLDWFGPKMPNVQYGGWCSCSIPLEPGCSKFRGELTRFSSGVGSLGVQPFPTWGAFPFIVQGGAPIYIYLALCLGTVEVSFVLVSCRGPLSRSRVGRLDPSDLLGQWVVQVLSHPRPVGAAWSVGWSLGVTSGLVRLGLCPLSAGPPLASLALPLLAGRHAW